ncbi:MAG: N-ATPase subunit AtpR [Alphaproteobacteria bacterium]|nr:ATP synthase subunit I [Alphaproteobacteria bacterium]
MNEAVLTSLPVTALAMAFAGLVFGLAYFRAVRWTVNLLAEDHGWMAPVGLTLARVTGAVMLLTFMARAGAMPLLAGFVGFLLARMIALRPARRTR